MFLRQMLRAFAVGCAVALMLPLVALANGGSGSVGVVDTTTGIWYLRDAANGETTSFYYGNPGDVPIIGDWDCDGDETPGLYRQSDGFVYLRNSNSQGVGDIRFFFGNPGDLPIAGDFNNDGCDTVSIYRPTEGRVFIINELGKDEGGLGAAEFDYYFGNPGDKPFVGDFDNDGIDEVGLHRESTGLVYFRLTHTQGIADAQFIYGNPGDKIIAADWAQSPAGAETVGIFRPSNGRMYLNFENSAGNADIDFAYGNSNMLPVAGDFGLLGGGDLPPPPNAVTFGSGIWRVGIDIPAGTYRMPTSQQFCYWARLSGFSGQLDDIIANNFTNVHQIVTISPTDVGFESDDCGTWTNQLGTQARQPTQSFSGGMFFVGSEVAAGTWQNSDSSGGCYWERLSGFSGRLSDIIANQFTFNPTVVTVSAGDAGFHSEDCGTWTYLGP